MLTPERIRETLLACEGWRYAASIELGITADQLRILMRRYQDQGHTFPKAKNRRFVEAKTAEILQPGQWVEAGQGQEFGEIVERKGGRLLVRFTDERAEWRPIAGLTWVPSGDVIADATRQMRANWPPGERAKRARWAYCGEYEIPQVVLEDDSRDDTW